MYRNETGARNFVYSPGKEDKKECISRTLTEKVVPPWACQAVAAMSRTRLSISAFVGGARPVGEEKIHIIQVFHRITEVQYSAYVATNGVKQF